MLNGTAPIIIFNFKKLVTLAQSSGIPLISDLFTAIPLVPIPIYLDERRTGIYIDTEDKNIDIVTETETMPDGTTPKANQRGLNSIVTVNMVASKDSVGLMILSAMADLIFAKVTSQEYSISYLHGPVTIFGGLLEGFQVKQISGSTKLDVSMQISRATQKATETVAAHAPLSLDPVANAIPL